MHGVGRRRNTVRESLREQSLDTAGIAHALAVIGREQFGVQIEPEKVAACALFHDASEILTGDMPTPVKYHNPEIKNAFHSVERAARGRLLDMLPQNLRPSYEVLFAFETGEPLVTAYVKAADTLSAYFKCLDEQRSGNREFDSALSQLEQAVRSMSLAEADYFMENFIPSFGLTLDELSAGTGQNEKGEVL